MEQVQSIVKQNCRNLMLNKGAMASLHTKLANMANNLETQIDSLWHTMDHTHAEVIELNDNFKVYGQKLAQLDREVNSKLNYMENENRLSQQILMIQSRMVAQHKLQSHYQRWIKGLITLQEGMLDATFIPQHALFKAVSKLTNKL